jgi:hypothetical protein
MSAVLVSASADTVVVKTLRCMECGQSSLIELDASAFARWQAGAFVQDAFPDMSAPERETLITGTHSACWDAIFADEEDE